MKASRTACYLAILCVPCLCVDITYSYDYTADAPGMKGEGTLKNFPGGKQVVFRGFPGKSWGFTLSCQGLSGGGVRAIYTDATPEEYYGNEATGSGCSNFRGGSHSHFSCCLPDIPVPAGADISLKHSDCGGDGWAGKILDFGPARIARGKKTTMVAHGTLDFHVYSGNFELTMTGAHSTNGAMVKCTGDASQTKSCPLPTGLGSLTMHKTVPLEPSYVKTNTINIDIYFNESMPEDLLTTTTVLKITDKHPPYSFLRNIFCLKIESAPAASSNTEVVV